MSYGADEFIARNLVTLREDPHGWERRFVERILSNVRDLDFANVQAQTPLRDVDGTKRRIDFTITEPHGVRIALEVDGYNKNGANNRGMTSQQFADWSRREQQIVAQGWTLLRFANTVQRDEPDFCISNIEKTLMLQRELAARVQNAESRAGELERQLAKTRLAVADAERRYAEAVERAERTGESQATTEMIEAERGLVAAQREQTEAVHGTALELLGASAADEIVELEDERARGLVALRQEIVAQVLRADRAEKENQQMKTVVAAIAAIVVATAVIVAALTGGDDTPKSGAQLAVPAGATSSTQAAPAESRRCSDAIRWQDAAGHIGESATVAGPVVTATYRAESNGSPTFINVGAPYGDDSRFVVVVFGESRDKFPKAPETAYRGQAVAVTGVIAEYQGVAQMVINSPSAITRC